MSTVSKASPAASNRTRLVERLAHPQAGQEQVDAFVTSTPVNVRYLTGFTGSNGGVLVTAGGDARVATDGRYTTQISQQVPDIEALGARNVLARLLEFAVATDGLQRIGLEANHLTFAEWNTLREKFGEQLTLVPLSGEVETLRMVKGAEELSELSRVAHLATSCFEQLLADGVVRAGKREREIAAELECRFRMAGTDGIGFDTIVASGPNSAKPHHGASDRVIQSGDLVTFDFGVISNGWNSDMTRTVAVGEPSARAREIYETVQRAQAAGVAAVTAGVTCAEVDKACRDIITEAGFGDYFVHSTGHGLGLDVHEAPALAATSADTLSAGMVVTVEPGIYIPGECGVRIEDSVVVTDSQARVLTNWTRELQILMP